VRGGLLRPSDGRRLDLDLVREVIKVESVRGARVIDGATGYIQIVDFSDHTGEQFDDALNDLLKKGIDSPRHRPEEQSPAASWTPAVRSPEPFFKKGELIAYTLGRNPSDKETYLSETDGEPLHLPVARAHQRRHGERRRDRDRRPEGRGQGRRCRRALVRQGLRPDDLQAEERGGAALTTAHYYPPSGVMINAHGVSPQVEVRADLGR